MRSLPLIAALTCLTLPGCAAMGLGSLAEAVSTPDWLAKNPFEKTTRANLDDDDFDPRDPNDAEDATALVGEYVTVSGMNPIVLEGVGLVTGLRNTGGDLPPSNHRRMILEDMKRRRVPAPNRILQSPTTAVVNVRVFVPPLAAKHQRLDVEVSLPPGSEATSLRGGLLQDCSLFESGFVPGRGTMKGDELARATGRVLITAADETGNEEHLAGVLRRGTIPAGGRYIGEPLHLGLSLKTKYRSVRNSQRVAKKIGVRFHDFDEYGNRKPLAEAKTDSRIQLDIPRNYRDNFQRYLQVVRRVRVRESEIELRIRMDRLRAELLQPLTARAAALALEAVGRDAIPMLRDGLEADNEVSRFHAAEALAYLGEDAGVKQLAEAAAESRTARVHAFLAMASMRGGEAIPELVPLLAHENAEVRYGAVRAITTVDEIHPDVRPEVLGQSGGQFVLRAIDLPPTSEPLVHITKRRKSEVCVFGPEQTFRLPMMARAGHRILVVGRAGGQTIELTKIVGPDEEPERQVVSRQVDAVIRACSEMGANYPDVVALLMQADRQHNLPGRLAFDALPEAGRRYGSAPKSRGGDEIDAGDDLESIDDEPIEENSEPEIDTAPVDVTPKSPEPTELVDASETKSPMTRVTPATYETPADEPNGSPVAPAFDLELTEP